MKLLVITPLIPYPLSEGGKISQFAFLEYLQNKVDITLMLFARNPYEQKLVEDLSIILPKVKIDMVKLFNDNDIVQKRKFKNRLKGFIRRKLLSAATSLEPKCEQKELNDFRCPIAIIEELDEDLANEICKRIDSHIPDIVQIEHNGLLNLICALNPKYKTIFVEHEIQFVRYQTGKSSMESDYQNYKIDFTKTIEVPLLNKYSMVFTFSEADKIKLKDSGVISKIGSTPFPVLDNAFEEVSNLLIKKIIFVGGENHYPNIDAVEWYIKTIAEYVYRETNLKLHIIGWWTEAFKTKHQCDYVVFDGFVENLKEACRNSLLIVPLRIGSGIRTKILYGMAQSLPVISTNIGCEGIGARNGEEIIIADEITDFANKIITIYRDPEMANRISQRAYSYVRANYSQAYLGEQRLLLYEELKNEQQC